MKFSKMQDHVLPTSSPLILQSSPPPSDDEDGMADDEDEDDSDFDADVAEFLGYEPKQLWYVEACVFHEMDMRKPVVTLWFHLVLCSSSFKHTISS